MLPNKHALQVVLMVVTGAMLLGSAPEKSRPADSSAHSPAERHRYTVLSLIGETRSELMQQLGQPDHVKTHTVRNRHYPAVFDRIHTLHYSGLIIRIYEASLTGNEFITTIALQNPQFALTPEIRIGGDPQGIARVLGAPARVRGDLLIFDAEQEGIGRLTLRLRKRVIESILWEPYFD